MLDVGLTDSPFISWEEVLGIIGVHLAICRHSAATRKKLGSRTEMLKTLAHNRGGVQYTRQRLKTCIIKLGWKVHENELRVQGASTRYKIRGAMGSTYNFTVRKSASCNA